MNWLKNDILFTQPTGRVYTAANPPSNWPLPPVFIAALAQQDIFLPSTLHVSELRQEHEPGDRARRERVRQQTTPAVFANYSYQTDPDPKDFPLSELNLPPNNRFNLGASFTYDKFLGNLSVTYTDEAFWQDVLNDPFHGTTEPYTLVNAGFGFRWLDDKVTTSLKFVNLANSSVQQHVFGDITKFQMVAEVKVQFPGR